MTRRSPSSHPRSSALTSASPPSHRDPVAPESAELAVAPRPSPSHGPAAGPAALWSVARYANQTSGLLRGARALLRVNQASGFDCSGCAWPEPRERSAAEFCENGARAVLHEADSRRVDLQFFREHSIDDLRGKSDYWLEQQGRLVTPVIRRPGGTHYEPLSYEEALTLAGKALSDLDSPDQAIFYTSGRASNEAAFLYQLFARTFGTNNLPDCSNMCHESSGRGLGTTLGVGKGTVSLDDFELADCIFVFGQNPGTNHPRMLTTLAEARKRGAAIVAVNPLRERGLESFAHPQTPKGLVGIGAPIASHYVQIRTGGDVALLKGMMKELLAIEAERGGVLDRAFIDEHTTGFEALRRDLDETPWDNLVEECGVSRAAIRELAELYAKSERVIAAWAMGLTQHKNGVGNVRSVVNLLLLRGNVGRPGAGVCPVRGHSNVQGDRTMGIYEAPTEKFLARLDAATGITSPRAHGVDAVGAVQALEAGSARIFVALGGNFAAAMSDTQRTAAALRRAALTVQISTKLNRSHLEAGETAIILPCLARSERDIRAGKAQFVSVENSMSVVSASEGRLSPAAPELWSEVALVAGLARRTLGGRSAAGSVDWSSLAEEYDRIRDLVERAIDGFQDYNARVRTPSGFRLPNAARERHWNTASGKAEFTAQPLAARALRPDELLLMTIRSHDQFNTTLYGLDDRYRGVFGTRDVVFIHPDDLASRGLRDGQAVQLTSRHGEETRTLRGFRVIAYDVPRGCVAAYYPETNPLVVLESYADESRTPASKSVVVTLAAESAAAPPPPLLGERGSPSDGTSRHL